MAGLPLYGRVFMFNEINNTVKKLDKEWIELIKMAKQVGISIEEVREYLLQNKSFSSTCTFSPFK